jgi:hypothetical protein
VNKTKTARNFQSWAGGGGPPGDESRNRALTQKWHERPARDFSRLPGRAAQATSTGVLHSGRILRFKQCPRIGRLPPPRCCLNGHPVGRRLSASPHNTLRRTEGKSEARNSKSETSSNLELVRETFKTSEAISVATARSKAGALYSCLCPLSDSFYM